MEKKYFETVKEANARQLKERKDAKIGDTMGYWSICFNKVVTKKVIAITKKYIRLDNGTRVSIATGRSGYAHYVHYSN